jgi:predicted O-methyltransferase YrrM
MLKRIIRRAAYAIAPEWAAQYEKTQELLKNAKRLRRKCNQVTSLEEVVDAVMNCPLLRASQKSAEILSLLKTLASMQPRSICEIGSAGGGSLFLFCQVASPHARILSIDINHTPHQQRAYRQFARNGQRITCLPGDSHADRTVLRVKGLLNETKLDFLFIDGDHSLAGVSSDFSSYARFVRPGGIIAFHDIVPDFRTRYGITTGSDVGQVPAFWANLKQNGHKTFEFIEDPQQDGYGIGLLQWQTEAAHLMTAR